MRQIDANSIVFQHLIDLPNCDCMFCSTVETSSGKTRLFLVFNERKRVYIRNGIKDTWDELKSESDYEIIWEKFNRAMEGVNVPCFSA